jgi:hypothetical protein
MIFVIVCSSGNIRIVKGELQHGGHATIGEVKLSFHGFSVSNFIPNDDHSMIDLIYFIHVMA